MDVLGIDLYDLVQKNFIDLINDEKLKFALDGLQSGITEQTILEIKTNNKVVRISTRQLDSNRYGVGAVLLIIEDTSKFRELDKIKTDFI